MRIYMNFTEIDGPYGGANSFLRTLKYVLQKRGIQIVLDVEQDFDLAFLNALTNEIDINFVKAIAQRNIPIVHRKVGYRVSGSPEMRKLVNGVVWGDRLQIDFSPYIQHSIFQSFYSRNVFIDSGFSGEYSVIHNGINETIFNIYKAQHLGGLIKQKRTFWNEQEPLKIIISTWSRDLHKGFEEYRKIDRALTSRSDVSLALVGRIPEGWTFSNIRVYEACPHRELAQILKKHHVLLQLSEFETCSNALIEGINCGLPAIYLDSGANKEIAEDYGVKYQKNVENEFEKTVDKIKNNYHQIIKNIHSNPYKMELVANRYFSIFKKLVS